MSAGRRSPIHCTVPKPAASDPGRIKSLFQSLVRGSNRIDVSALLTTGRGPIIIKRNDGLEGTRASDALQALHRWRGLYCRDGVLSSMAVRANRYLRKRGGYDAH